MLGFSSTFFSFVINIFVTHEEKGRLVIIIADESREVILKHQTIKMISFQFNELIKG